MGCVCEDGKISRLGRMFKFHDGTPFDADAVEKY